jgi:glycosyltransferase involved in cell wall biosynthesis
LKSWPGHDAPVDPAPVKGESTTNYVAVTPARDEERLLPQLISSMARQTHLPERWIIVDDGSTDATAAIIDHAARSHEWIEPHHIAHNGARAEGGESVIKNLVPPQIADRYAYILRLDADLSFGSDFVEQLLAEFKGHPRLGIAGATLYEPEGTVWREIQTPRFHTRGAAKMYSARCFKAIGGLDSGLGWDTVDEASALMLGFETRSFRHIWALHHRPQAAAGGRWRGRVASGRAAFRAGYSLPFMMARAAAHVGARPYLIGSLLMLGGFFEGYIRRLPRAASPELIRFVRAQQRRRLLMMDSVWR